MQTSNPTPKVFGAGKVNNAVWLSLTALLLVNFVIDVGSRLHDIYCIH